jgi:hypothetical protein
MKAFRAVFIAIDQTDGQLKEFDWKPIFAKNLDEAESFARSNYPFVKVCKEDKNKHIHAFIVRNS